MKRDEYITILKAEYERLKEIEKRMNILVQGVEIQKSTFSHGLELLKRQKTLRKETHCTHFHSISGIQRWCDKGVFPPDCATCTQGDWEEYWVEETSTSTNKED